MSPQLGYDTSLGLAQQKRRPPKPGPHYHLHRERDGIHVEVDSWDSRRGPSHLDHVEVTYAAAFDWATTYHRVLEGN